MVQLPPFPLCFSPAAFETQHSPCRGCLQFLPVAPCSMPEPETAFLRSNNNQSSCCCVHGPQLCILCRVASGPCEEDATCSGSASACPQNPLKPAGTACGSSTACRVAPLCTGTSAVCPIGSQRPDKTVCLQDDPAQEYPYSDAPRMSLSACGGQCKQGTCQQKLNKFGCCYNSTKVGRKTVKTVYCW